MDTREPKRVRGWTTLLAVLALALGTCAVIAIAGATQTHADVAAAPDEAGQPPAARVTATQSITVRPVTADGHPVEGWRVTTMRDQTVTCEEPAPAAVDDGIAWCFPTAVYAIACWRAATAHRVLCLGDPREHELRSFALDGRFPAVSAPKDPLPQALVLDTGDTYLVRDGGAASPLRQHPTWVDFYYSADRALHSISGPRGITMRHADWFVTTFENSQANGVRHNVRTAYLVGTAR